MQLVCASLTYGFSLPRIKLKLKHQHKVTVVDCLSLKHALRTHWIVLLLPTSCNVMVVFPVVFPVQWPKCAVCYRVSEKPWDPHSYRLKEDISTIFWHLYIHLLKKFIMLAFFLESPMVGCLTHCWTTLWCYWPFKGFIKGFLTLNFKRTFPFWILWRTSLLIQWMFCFKMKTLWWTIDGTLETKVKSGKR